MSLKDVSLSDKAKIAETVADELFSMQIRRTDEYLIPVTNRGRHSRSLVENRIFSILQQRKFNK